MNILAIDIGTYSVKFVEVRSDRKNLVLVEKAEIVLDEVRALYPNAVSIKDLQKEIVSNYIQKKSNELKIIFQLPNEMLTTRFMEIPGTSRRKAEQIIPFQLDENLPYPLSDSHFSSRLQKHSGGFSVLSNITQGNLFREFFTFFETKDSGPSILTSEISIIQSYVDKIRMNETCCILDIGHKTTKAYFIQNRQIVSNQTSYVAGAQITEVIASTYQISPEDALVYKHANAFFLTEDQFDNVTDEQFNFAILMKKIMSSLLLDFKRWEVGHRVKFGKSIDKIFIIGGTTQIIGIDHFLNYYTGLPVSFLPPLTDIKHDYLPNDKIYCLAKMMAISISGSASLINFLTGKFQTASNSFISIHSAFFIIVRSLILATILLLGLLSERFFFLNKDEKNLDAKITSLLKTPSLEISKKDQKEYKTKPLNVLNAVKRKNKMVKDEVSSILSSHSINALRPLAILSQSIAKNPNVSLSKFTSDGFNVQATFIADEPQELAAMQTHLKNSGLLDLRIQYQAGQNTLLIDFSDRD